MYKFGDRNDTATTRNEQTASRAIQSLLRPFSDGLGKTGFEDRTRHLLRNGIAVMTSNCLANKIANVTIRAECAFIAMGQRSTEVCVLRLDSE